MCVQNFDDSRGLAIRITYRISLRSSSLWEPRHPLLKVVMSLAFRASHPPEGRTVHPSHSDTGFISGSVMGFILAPPPEGRVQGKKLVYV